MTTLPPIPAEPEEQLGDLPAVVSLLPLPAVAFEQPLLSTELQYPQQVGSCPCLNLNSIRLQTTAAPLQQVLYACLRVACCGSLALKTLINTCCC